MKHLLLLVLLVSNARAEFRGFRWDRQSGQCLNVAGRAGRNPRFLGECGELRGEDLRYLNLRDTLAAGGLRGADLREADLRTVNLTALDLSGADLRDARLEGTIFSGTLLNGARLDGARL